MFLGWVAMTSGELSGDFAHNALVIGTRASLVVLIEALALFFLRTYRRSLEDLRFLHNETSTAQLRFFAIERVEGGEVGGVRDHPGGGAYRPEHPASVGRVDGRDRAGQDRASDDPGATRQARAADPKVAHVPSIEARRCRRRRPREHGSRAQRSRSRGMLETCCVPNGRATCEALARESNDLGGVVGPELREVALAPLHACRARPRGDESSRSVSRCAYGPALRAVHGLRAGGPPGHLAADWQHNLSGRTRHVGGDRKEHVRKRGGVTRARQPRDHRHTLTLACSTPSRVAGQRT
jgi:hypothetical protein